MVTPQDTTNPSEPTAAGMPSQEGKSGVGELRDTVREAGAEMQAKAREAREQLSGRAQELRTQAKEVASDYYQQGRERALEWERTLESRIREKPIQSLLIAGGIGLLLGLLWKR